MRKIENDLAKLAGLTTVLLIILVGLWLAVYAVLGLLTDQGRHVVATALVFAVPLAYALGLEVAKSHRSGIERGLRIKTNAQKRSTSKPSVPIHGWNHLLPDVPDAAVIVERNAGSDEAIDLG